MRFPFGLKIFGLATLLLCLMAIVAFLSLARIRRVNTEIASIADYKMPLTTHVRNMVVEALEQEIHLESLLRLYETTPRDLPAIQLQQQRFAAREQQFDQEVLAASRLARQGVELSQEAVDTIEFSRLDILLQDIDKQHQNFHDRALAMLALFDQGLTERADELQEILAQDEEAFNAQVTTVLHGLANFVNQSTLEAEHHEQYVLRLNVLMTIGATILGLLCAFILTRGLTGPVHQLLDGTRAIERGDLDVTVHVTSRDEIGVLTQAFNTMARELRVKERIKDTFGKYLDPRIVERLLQQPDMAAAEGERRIMTVLFADMENFTTLSEQLTPPALVRVVNQYLTLMSEPIKQHHGVIDKYIGDAVMAFWGPPFTTAEDHASAACWAALAQLDTLDTLRQRLPEVLGFRGQLPPINIRVGLATGEVIVGTIGSDVARSYTVLGDTVNVAARLESANKQYGTRLLLSEATWQMARDAIETRELDSIQVVGKSEPVRIFELLARKGDLTQARADLREHFEHGLQAYRTGDWLQAQDAFQACLTLAPHDTPSRVFLERLQYLQAHPPADQWDGVWRLVHK